MGSCSPRRSLIGIFAAAIVSVSGLCATPSTSDLFDTSNGSTVLETSGVLFPAENMLGGELPSAEARTTVFADGKPEGFRHFITWKTATPVRLESVNLFAAGDSAIYAYEREFSEFVLKAKLSSSDQWVTILAKTNIAHPYQFFDESSNLLVSQSVAPLTGQVFRAEFVQWNAGRGYDAPRVIELDGFGVSLPGNSGALLDWTFEEGFPGTIPVLVQDQSGNNHSGKNIIGQPLYSASAAATGGDVSLFFPGAGDQVIGHGVRTLSTIELNPGTNFTLEASFNPGEDNATWNRGIVVAENATNGKLAYGLDYRSENRTVDFFVVDSAGLTAYVPARIPDDGKSHHVAGSLSNSVITIFLDGLAVTNSSTTLTPGIAPGEPVVFTVGANSIGGYAFNGTVDRIRLTARALGSGEFFMGEPDPSLEFPPVILSQTESLLVPAGGEGNFSVTATAKGSISYQWFLNDLPIDGAVSNILTITNAGSSNVGTYIVEVFGNGGSTRSKPAELKIYNELDRPLLNIDFGSHDNPCFHTKLGPAAVGLGTNDFWNIYSRDDGYGGWVPNNQLQNLIWSDGLNSSINLGVTNAAGAWHTLNSDPMFESYLYPLSRTGNIGITISSLPQGVYDLYIYAHGQPAAENARVRVSTASTDYGTKTTSASTDWDQPYWTEGGQYVFFPSVVVNPGTALTIVSEPGESGLAVVNGMQLVLKEGERNQFDPVVADWTFEEGVAGQIPVNVKDYSARGHHASTIIGHPVFFNSAASVPGKLSMNFPGAGNSTFGNALRPADSVDFNFSGEFTLEASVNPGPDNAIWNRGILVGQNQYGQLAYGFDYRSENGIVDFFIVSAFGEVAYIPGPIIKDGASHHVAGTFKNGEMKLYVDKKLIASLTTTITPGMGGGEPGRFTIGANDVGGYAFNGVIDRVRLTAKALTLDEFFPAAGDAGGGLTILQGLAEQSAYSGEIVTFKVSATSTLPIQYSWYLNNDLIPGQTNDLLVLDNIQTSQSGVYKVVLTSGVEEKISTARLNVAGQVGEYTILDWTFEHGIPPADVNMVKDDSGRGHDATHIIGRPQFVATDSSSSGNVSINFAGSPTGLGQAIQPSDSVDFNLGTEFTIELSLNPGTNNITWNRGILVGEEPFSRRLAYVFDYRSENRVINFAIVATNGAVAYISGNIPDDGKSHHVAGVFKNQEMTLFIDKQTASILETPLTPGLAEGSPGKLTLGANSLGSYSFNGILDRVRISKKALNASEFFTMANGPASELILLKGLADQTVTKGADLHLFVNATAPGPISYLWKFNGVVLSNETTALLNIPGIQPDQAGSYSVTVQSGTETVTSTANVTVQTEAGAPSIVLDPINQTVMVGGAVQFNVLASSSSPMFYQWYFNGEKIQNATNQILFLPAINYEMAGNYTVEVGNVNGTVQSRPGHLEVQSSGAVGMIHFNNRGAGVDAPIFGPEGEKLSGSAYSAQLFARNDQGDYEAVGGSVYLRTGLSAGYFSGGIREIPWASAGELVSLQVRAWESIAGPTYASAVAAGGLRGESEVFQLTAGGGALSIPGPIGLKSFSLYGPPSIKEQPANLTLLAGESLHLAVLATGQGPLSYRWFKDNNEITKVNSSQLEITNAQPTNSGNYFAVVGNTNGYTTSRVASVVVRLPDNTAPIVQITGPVGGDTETEQVVLTGIATDNIGVVRADWTKNGQVMGPVSLDSNGGFVVGGIVLSKGVNILAVRAFDEAGNVSSAEISLVLQAGRTVALPSTTEIQEGGIFSLPVTVASKGDIGAISFSVSFDSNYFADASVEWSAELSSAFTQVNTAVPGVLRAALALPGVTLPGGTNLIATLTLRARSIPAEMESEVRLEVQGVYSSSGDAINNGTDVLSGTVRLLKRKIVADNNANDRLDVGDASVVMRYLTFLDPVRDWDTAANDVNSNSQIDAGDVIRILRAVANIDPQPSIPLRQSTRLKLGAVPEAGHHVFLVSDKTRLNAGDIVRVSVRLADVGTPVSGASFQLHYPASVLRLESPASHKVGSSVPSSALAFWNVSPAQDDYDLQDGTVSVAISSAAAWTVSGGDVAYFDFKVQPGVKDRYLWEVLTSDFEISNLIDVEGETDSSLRLFGRDPLPATIDSVTPGGSSGIKFSVAGESGATYRIEFSEDLKEWSEFGVQKSTDGIIQVQDADNNNSIHRFFRVIQMD